MRSGLMESAGLKAVEEAPNREEARNKSRQMKMIVAMLERGEKFHP